MQRFGNLKVGSVFGFLHSETAVSVSIFKLLFFKSYLNRGFGFGLRLLNAHTHHSTVHTALFPLVPKRTKQLANIQTSYYVAVGRDKFLHQQMK